ncbi:MAG: FtsW/RodA/SpoVE family cell cycle protein [Candidatus Nealsonbacteria bacterium]|nr:FtsW/RodA/SpoVE family cell cycle protein [Candidatus Nealsonbacteria bacterium]
MIAHFKRLDWLMIASIALIVAFGLLSIYSSSLGRGEFGNFKKQVVFVSFGLLLMFLISFFDWRALKDNPYLMLALYVICLLSLIGLFFFAPEIRGTKSWYKLGPVSLDPIEFTKLILIVILAKYFSARHIEMYRINHILFSGFYVFLPSVLVFFQPNIGSVLILLSIWLGTLVISGIKLRHFLLLVLCGLLIFGFSWQTALKDYQKARILSFVKPEASDALAIGWNQRQAKIAVGSGGLLGQGIGKGSQTQYGFLPEPQTDFVFSAVAEETGLAGVLILFFLFAFLIWRMVRVALEANNNFARLFVSGLITVLISEIFINIGMNIGILPIIGIPLPLASYGGSGLIALFVGFGIIQSIKTNS